MIKLLVKNTLRLKDDYCNVANSILLTPTEIKGLKGNI